MSLKNRVLATAPAIVIIGVVGVGLVVAGSMGCAKAQVGTDASSTPADGAAASVDATGCAGPCDQDGDGVPDGTDQCPDTPRGSVVNHAGCADSQLTPTLEDTFPPYGLTWTPTGDLGRAGGLTWSYTGIARGDLFHIDWIVCDDPATPCGLSLDGAVDAAPEHWQFSSTDSDLAHGKLAFVNTTQIFLADATSRPLSGRLTVTIIGANETAIPVDAAAALGVTARSGKYGAEITGTGFTVVALAEVEDNVTSTWTPYLDYYDAAPTPDVDAGGPAATSFGGSFYDK